jgi:hypothetical protein
MLPNDPQAATADPAPIECEVLFQVSRSDPEAGFLVIRDGAGAVIEIPMSKVDAIVLTEALIEFVSPGHRLREAPPAGRA